MHYMKHRGVVWIASIVGLLIIVGLVYAAATSTKTSSAPKGPIEPVASADWMKGSPLAKTILIEYSDFQCPACRNYYPVVKKIEHDFGQSVQIVYRHFPLTQIHKNAFAAAKAAEAAGKQGKFWEMHDMLFEQHDLWAEDEHAVEKFTSFANELHLAIDQFKKDMDSKEVSDKVSRMIKSGESAGIDATPTFYLNGEKIQNPQGFEPFAALIKKSQEK